MGAPRLRCPECLAAYRTGYTYCPSDGASLFECSDEPLVGTTLHGRYVIEKLVGEGSMGLVYRARHVRLPRTFAIKVLFGDLASDPRMRLRFAREAAAASRLGHPNVIPVVDYGESERGLLYLVMDYVDGEPLSQLIAREAPLGPHRAIGLARELAHGLGHAHTCGLVHRDFKPDNVLLVPRDHEPPIPRILDFGLAISTRETEDSEMAVRLTECGYVVGTPIYLSPEQARDLPVDHRADLFALGVVLYEMLVGRPPFDGTPMDVAHKNMVEPLPPMRARNRAVSVPPAIEAVVGRLCAKAPEARFQSAQKLIDALDAVEAKLGGAGSVPSAGLHPRPPTGLPDPGSTPSSPVRLVHRWPSRVAAASLILSAAAVFAYVVAGGAPGAAAPRTAAVRAARQVGVSAAAPPAESGPVGARALVGPPAAAAPSPLGSTTVAREIQAKRRGAAVRESTRARKAVRVKRRPAAAPPDPKTSDSPSAGSAVSFPAASKPSIVRLIRDYHRVGEAILRVEQIRGERVARPLRDRFFRLPFAGALRIASVRRDALDQLAALRRDTFAILR